jgi:hypothetical protein
MSRKIIHACVKRFSYATISPVARKNPHAVALGRKGGKKGGKLGGVNRWAGLTKEQRSEIARKAVQARWAKQKKNKKEKP